MSRAASGPITTRLECMLEEDPEIREAVQEGIAILESTSRVLTYTEFRDKLQGWKKLPYRKLHYVLGCISMISARKSGTRCQPSSSQLTHVAQDTGSVLNLQQNPAAQVLMRKSGWLSLVRSARAVSGIGDNPMSQVSPSATRNREVPNWSGAVFWVRLLGRRTWVRGRGFGCPPLFEPTFGDR